MATATNPQTGETVYLNDAGAWVPAPTAKNPQTGEELLFDGKGWQPKAAPAQSKGVLGYVDDAVRSVANGITFGYAGEFAAKMDEVTGRSGKSLSSLVTGESAYEANLKREKARDAQIPAGIAIPGQIAGNVATAVLAAPAAGAAAAATGLRALPQWARYAGAGAGMGALQGSGDAEPGLENRATGAATGGAVGAFVGGAAPSVVRGVSNTFQSVKNAFSPQAGVAQDLSRAILRDGDTPQALAQRAGQLAADRPGVATLADAGGENVKGLVERVAQTPGAGRTQVVPSLTVRQQGQMMRLSDDLGKMTGTSRTAHQAIEETMAARKADAKPLFDKAMDFNARAVPEIETAWQRETGSGWGKSVLDGPDFKKSLQTEYGIKETSVAPLMVQIKLWKEEVDGLIGEAVRAGNSKRAAVLGEMRDRVVKTVDQHNPAYSQARAAWAGPSKYMEAIEDGRGILGKNVSAEEMAPRFAAMSSAEQEAYRIGAVSALRAKMGNDPAKMADMTKYVRSPEMRAKITAIMPDKEAADAWLRKLDFEVSTSELTGRALGNSATARRLAEQQDAEGIVGDLVMTALSGSPAVSIWRRALTAVPNKVRDTLRSRTDAGLATALTEPVGAQNANQLARVLIRTDRIKPPSARANLGAIAGGNALFVP